MNQSIKRKLRACPGLYTGYDSAFFYNYILFTQLPNMRNTNNGAATYEHSLDHALEFFSKAGSLFEKRSTFYGSEETALSLFQKTWIVEKEVSFKLLLWLRDCRGGAGNRSGFRSSLKWLAEHDPEWVKLNISQIPELGRWDDLTALYDTPCESEALELWASEIKKGGKGNLACKWAGRKDNKLRKYMGLTPKEYRKLLVAGTQVVESKMCEKNWKEIEYSNVPSVAMARYSSAFFRNDEERFKSFKEAVKKGETTVNTGALFPHDCVRTAMHGDAELADIQFQQLPNYLEGVDKRIVCICDTSGSMGVPVSGSVQAVHVSIGMSLYCSEKMGKENPFYRKFLQFESETHLTDWSNYSFSDVVNGKGNIFNGAVGSTNIEKALLTLLQFAKFYNAKPDQIPNVLLIVSDMQFNQMTTGNDKPVVEAIMKEWQEAGYEAPTIVYWNTAGYAGSPATVTTPKTALVSGFSPSLLKAVFSSEEITPRTAMNLALEKYDVKKPL